MKPYPAEGFVLMSAGRNTDCYEYDRQGKPGCYSVYAIEYDTSDNGYISVKTLLRRMARWLKLTTFHTPSFGPVRVPPLSRSNLFSGSSMTSCK